MDLRVSQAELVGMHIEPMGLLVSAMGLDIMGLTREHTVEATAVTELGTGMNGQGLWVTGVEGGVIVLVMGQSAMLCWLSGYTQYSNMELGLAWEKQKGRKMMMSRSESSSTEQYIR